MIIHFKIDKRGLKFHPMEFVEFIRTPKVDGVTLQLPHTGAVEGTLCVTGHHLILSSRKDSTEELWVRLAPKSLIFFSQRIFIC